MKLVVVAGARPNFMKVAPLMWEIGRRADVSARLVHTGQHYDERMSKLFFEQLRIPRPDVDLEVGFCVAVHVAFHCHERAMLDEMQLAGPVMKMIGVCAERGRP